MVDKMWNPFQLYPEQLLGKDGEYPPKLCKICYTDPIELKHHIVPVSKGGFRGIKIGCCKDCGNQIHMLFTNEELEKMGLKGLFYSKEMKIYIEWKKKHPGSHSYRASKKVKEFKKTHRGN